MWIRDIHLHYLHTCLFSIMPSIIRQHEILNIVQDMCLNKYWNIIIIIVINIIVIKYEYILTKILLSFLHQHK